MKRAPAIPAPPRPHANVLTAPVVTTPILAAPILAAPVIAAPVIAAPVIAASVITASVITAPVVAASSLAASVLTAPPVAAPSLAGPVVAAPVLSALPVAAPPVPASVLSAPAVAGRPVAAPGAAAPAVATTVPASPGPATRVFAAPFLAALAIAGSVAADEPARDWVFQVSPYLWASGVSGDVSPFVRSPTVPIDLSFSEILDDLRFGGFVMAYARRGRFVAVADAMYVDLEDRQDIRALPMIGPTPGLSARVETSQTAAALMAGWRVIDDPRGSLDLLAGARFWRISTELTARAGGRSRSWEEDFSWTDPIVGFRAFLPIEGRVSALVQADAGVGGRDTWGALAALNLEIGAHGAVSLGYKALSVDYDSGGLVYDATMKGPALGLTWRF